MKLSSQRCVRPLWRRTVWFVLIFFFVGAPLLLLSGCGSTSPVTDGDPVIIDAGAFGNRNFVDAQFTAASCAREVSEAACAVNKMESVVIADEKAYALSDGSLLRLARDESPLVVAQGGGGPGELRAPIALGTAENGGMSVYDIGKMRLVEVREGADAVESVVFPPSGFRSAKILQGELFAFAIPPSARIGDTVKATVLRFGRVDTAWVDTLARIPVPAVSVAGDEGTAISRLPWDATVLWDVCGNGEIVVGRSDIWGADWFRNGRSLLAVRRDLPSVKMTSAEHDSLSNDWLNRSPKLPSFRAALSRRLAEKPRERPQVRALFCVDANTVAIVNEPDFGGNTHIVDFVTREGILTMSARIPVRIRIVGTDGSGLLGIEELEGGDVLYRIAFVGY